MLLLKIVSVILGALVAVATADTNPICFNTCPGANATTYAAAITSFCSSTNNAKLSQYNSPGYDLSIILPYWYQPNMLVDEEGLILMEVSALRDDTCPDTMTLDEDTCIYNMYVPIQECNVGDPFKQGGYWTDPCLAWRFQPNPAGC